MTLRELIQRAVDIAVQGVPTTVDRSTVETTAEPLLPIVFGDVGHELAQSPRTRHILRRTKTVNVVDGNSAIPDDVLTEYACEAILYDPTDPLKGYSLTPREALIGGQLDDRLGHFLIENGVLTVVEPDTQFDPNSGPDISLRLIIPCAPEIPALDDDIAVPAEITDLLLSRLSQALKPMVSSR
jgi:hypothetical protein